MTYRSAILLTIVVTVFACSKKVTSAFLITEDATVRSVAPREGSPTVNPCNDPLAFAPNPSFPDHTSHLAVQVNMHFMDIGDGVHNLNKEQARVFAIRVVESCNAKLRTNAKMHLPPGNNTPVLSVPWYLALAPDPSIPGHDGIYFHYDTALYFYRHGKNTNRSSRDVVNKYALRTDSVINIFMMPHPPDSVGSPTYKAVGTGISLGSSIKVAQVFTPSLSPESCVGLLNHEIGHALGLSHTWGGNDGCDDTPKHDNCWYYTDEPPCDSLVSNNMMDYNAWQAALTPCQIGRVMRNAANLDSGVRKHIRADWCKYDLARTTTISDSVHWNVPKDLAGDVIVADGGVLELSCRLSLPEGGKIIVAPEGRLILNNCRIHNSCGDQWQGIEIQTRGKASGTVEIIGDPVIENAVHTVDFSR